MIYRYLGFFLVLAIGSIHLADANDSFKEAVYKGCLFYANGIGAFISAYLIYTEKTKWGWNLGLFISIGSFLGYIMSRTVGLPLIPAEPDAWFEPLGISSIIAEGLFIMLFILKSRTGGKA